MTPLSTNNTVNGKEPSHCCVMGHHFDTLVRALTRLEAILPQKIKRQLIPRRRIIVQR